MGGTQPANVPWDRFSPFDRSVAAIARHAINRRRAGIPPHHARRSCACSARHCSALPLALPPPLRVRLSLHFSGRARLAHNSSTQVRRCSSHSGTAFEEAWLLGSARWLLPLSHPSRRRPAVARRDVSPCPSIKVQLADLFHSRWSADTIGRRRVLAAGALLMAGSGVGCA